MIGQVAQERGHQVATSGPYRYVRHPMYLSLVLSWPALALLLGSYWALVPGLLASGIIVLRTVLEDRTLQDELPGYADYARQVRYRLIPESSRGHLWMGGRLIRRVSLKLSVTLTVLCRCIWIQQLYMVCLNSRGGEDPGRDMVASYPQ